MKYFATVFLLVLLVSCNKDDGGTDTTDDQVVCTQEFVFGLSITVLDIITTNVITSGITVKATSGSFSENLMFLNNVWVGAGERAGTYRITVEGADYVTFISDPITVTEDECHVITQSRTYSVMPN